MTRRPCRRDRGGLPSSVQVYDTTLRDGSQQEGISLTIDDKLRVAEQLDHLGVAFIEGGYPGANPKDAEFFQRASRELHLKSASLVAFGSTRRAGARVQEDPLVAEILRADTDAVCIVGKASELHVTETLRTSLEEAVAMVYDTVAYLSAEGRRVFFDAEHFFDGYFEASEFSRRVLDAAERGGAAGLVLCDTNGGHAPESGRRGPRDDSPADLCRTRRPLPQRLRVCDRQHARRRLRGRDADPGLCQRLRRASGKRRPLRGDRQPDLEARCRDDPPGADRA